MTGTLSTVDDSLDVKGRIHGSQWRGNSGVLLMNRYEIQVLRRRSGGRDLWTMAAARQCLTKAWRVAELRHRLRGSEV